jgi:glycerol-3-phosphate acyltransferase PlsY
MTGGLIATAILWLIGAVLAALLVARAIRTADRRSRGQEAPPRSRIRHG